MKEQERNKKVLIVNPYACGGGAKNASMLLYSILKNRMQDCDVTAVNAEPSRYSHLGILRYVIQYKHLLPQLKKNNDVDIAIFQGLFNLSSLYSLKMRKTNNVKIILVLHGDACPKMWDIFNVKSGVLKWIVWQMFCKRILRKADIIVVGSEFEADSVRNIVSPNRIKIIPMISHDENHKENYNYDGKYLSFRNKKYALYLGRLSHEKNIELLIKCWDHIKSTGKEIVLVIAGETSNNKYCDKLISLVNKKGLNKLIVFTGWVQGNDKSFLIRNAMCVLVPSIRESFCNVVLESVSTSTYVIFSKGVPWERIDGTAGVCLGFDETEWIRAIEYYCCRNEKLHINDRVKEQIVSEYAPGKIEVLWSDVIRNS